MSLAPSTPPHVSPPPPPTRPLPSPPPPRSHRRRRRRPAGRSHLDPGPSQPRRPRLCRRLSIPRLRRRLRRPRPRRLLHRPRPVPPAPRPRLRQALLPRHRLAALLRQLPWRVPVPHQEGPWLHRRPSLWARTGGCRRAECSHGERIPGRADLAPRRLPRRPYLRHRIRNQVGLWSLPYFQ